MTDGQPIRERMWDYVYGLLSPEENQEMVARIKSDPQVARLYAEVRLQGELVAQAAIVEDNSLHLSAETANSAAQIQPAPPKTTAAAGYRWSKWLAPLAASALVILLAAGFLWPRPDTRLLARNFVCADVVAPSSLPAGLTNQLVVNTYRVDASGEGTERAPAAVELRLVDKNGKQQFQKALQTDQSGQATVEVPGAVLEPGAKLELLASADNYSLTKEKTESEVLAYQRGQSPSLAVTAPLPIQPEPQIAYYINAAPEVDAAKDVPVTTWNLAAFSAKPTLAEPVPTEAQPNDAPVRDLAQANVRAATVNAQQFFQRAEGGARAAGVKTLAATSRPANPAKQETKPESVPQVVEAGKPVQFVIAPELVGKNLDVAVQCRGVTVAAITDNEATMLGRMADRKSQTAQRQITLPLPPEVDGLMEVEVFDQDSDQPEPVQRAFVYREPLRKLQVELPTFQEHVAAGEEVELKLRVTDETGKPAANTRLGVRVWNERLVKQLGDQPLLLTDVVRNQATNEPPVREPITVDALASNQAGRADLSRIAQQDFRYRRAMRNAPPPPAPTAQPEQPAQPEQQTIRESQLAERPAFGVNAKVELASNREAVKIALRTAADEAEAKHRRIVRALGMTALVGGVAVLVLVLASAALRATRNLQTLAIPLVTALASLLIGTAWLGWMPEHIGTQIAMVPRPRENAAAATSRYADSTDLTDPVVRSELATDEQRRGGRVAPGMGGEERLNRAADSAAALAPASASLGAATKPNTPAGPPLAIAPPGAAPSGFGGGLGSAAPAAGGMPGGALPGGPRPMLESAQAKTDAVVKLAENSAEKKLADKGSAAAPTSLPPSLYFNPNLQTDASGMATLKFTMPPGSSEYRILVDALGQGRIGSRQQLIAAP